MKQMCCKRLLCLIIGCATFALNYSTSATNTLSNLSSPVRGSDPVPYIGSAIANAFVTGPSSPLLLDFATLDANIAPGNGLALNIYKNIGGQIAGSTLGTWSQEQAGHGSDDYMFTGTAIDLDPNTSYWLVVSPLSGQSGAWYWTETSSADSAFGWSVGAHAYDGSDGWHYFGVEPYVFALDAIAVPEPTELLMATLLLVIASGVALRRYINNKKR